MVGRNPHQLTDAARMPTRPVSRFPLLCRNHRGETTHD